MSELSERVQSVLGDSYRIERELPPGGMSRLFLATERSLDRQVVVKILPPELARAADRAGDKKTAIDAYTRIEDTWAHADPEFQSVVKEARAALTRLSSDKRETTRFPGGGPAATLHAG